MKLQTHFSQIGLQLDKFSETLNQNFTPEMDQFGFFYLVKNYAEITLLIAEKVRTKFTSSSTAPPPKAVWGGGGEDVNLVLSRDFSS